MTDRNQDADYIQELPDFDAIDTEMSENEQ